MNKFINLIWRNSKSIWFSLIKLWRWLLLLVFKSLIRVWVYVSLFQLLYFLAKRSIWWKQVCVWNNGKWWVSTVIITAVWNFIFHIFFDSSFSSFLWTHWWTFALSTWDWARYLGKWYWIWANEVFACSWFKSTALFAWWSILIIRSVGVILSIYSWRVCDIC